MLICRSGAWSGMSLYVGTLMDWGLFRLLTAGFLPGRNLSRLKRADGSPRDGGILSTQWNLA